MVFTFVVTVVNGFLIFRTWARVKRQEQERRERLRAIVSEPGSNPSVLIVDLHKEADVEVAVRRHFETRLAMRLPDDALRVVSRTDWQTPQDLEGVQREVRQKWGELVTRGTDRIHFYFAGPGAIAAAVGAILSNGPPVVIYQYHRRIRDYRPFPISGVR